MLKARLFAAALAFPLALGVTLGLVAPREAQASTRHRAKKATLVFPMKAEEYRSLMDKRMDSVRAVIDRKLDRRGVSAERKKAIHKIFDDAIKDLKAEIAHATADGTVTQAEADKIKPLANGLRAKVRERLRAEKTDGKPSKDGAKDKPGKHHAEPTKDAKVDPKHDSKHEAHGKDGAKVAKADAPKGGTTKATKSKADAKKKPGPTKHAKTPLKTPEAKKPREPSGGEADL